MSLSLSTLAIIFILVSSYFIDIIKCLNCQLPVDEISSLQQLYNATYGPSWYWKNITIYGPIWDFDDGTSNICGTSTSKPWQGINCVCNNGNIGSLLSLDLADYGLIGELPDDVFYPFMSLIALNLESNLLYGTIPFSIGSLVSLQELSLYFNMLSGIIPQNLGELKNLSHLSLYSNDLYGTIPSSLQSLYQIKTLYLHENHLTGTIPDDIGQLTNLQELWLYLNIITGTLPSSLGDLISLSKLYINHNHLTGSIPSTFVALVNLYAIDLAVNSLSGTLPSFLLSYPKLYSASLASNCFRGRFPTGLCDDPQAGQALSIVVMDGLSSNPACPHNIKLNEGKPWFIKGYLQANTLEGTLPSCIWTLPNLTSFHISGNALQGSLHPIPIQSQLIDVAASHNLLSGDIPKSIQRHAFTSRFDISSNRLSGTLVSDFNVQSSQQYLQLSVNRISGNLPYPIIQSWSNMTTLDVLTGNHYQCKNGMLPHDDPSHKIYSCASNDLDTAVYAWFGFLIVLMFIMIFCVYLATRKIRYHMSSSSHATGVDRGSINRPSLPTDRQQHHHMNKKPSTKRAISSITSQSSSHRGSSSSILSSSSIIASYQWQVQMLDHSSRAVLYTIKWWKETTSVNLSSYEQQPDDDATNDVDKKKMMMSRGSIIPHTILFLEFIRIVGLWSIICMLVIVMIAMPFNVIGNIYGLSSVQQTYGYVISSVYMHGGLPVAFIAVMITILIFKIKMDSNYHRLKAIRYLTMRTGAIQVMMNSYWSSVLSSSIQPKTSSSSSSSSSGQHDELAYNHTSSKDHTPSSSNHHHPIVFQVTSKRTVVSYLLTFTFQVINLIATAVINITYVNSIEADTLTTLTFLFLQVWIGCFKFIWSNTFIPWATKMMQYSLDMPSKTAMTHRYIMLIVNYLVSPCIATLVSNQSCFYYIFKPYDLLSAEFADSVCNFAYDATTGAISCRSQTRQQFQASYSPPFLYSYHCGSALLTSYVPVLLYAYSISGMILPIVRLTLLRNPSLRKYLMPFKFLRDLHTNRLLQQNDGRVVLDGKATIVTLMLHLTVLLTFGASYPMLGFAVAFTIFAETATHKLTMGKFLFITKHVNNKKKMIHDDDQHDDHRHYDDRHDDGHDDDNHNMMKNHHVDDKASYNDMISNPMITNQDKESVGIEIMDINHDHHHDHHDDALNDGHHHMNASFDHNRSSDHHMNNINTRPSLLPSLSIIDDITASSSSSPPIIIADSSMMMDDDEEKIIDDYISFDPRLTTGGNDFAMEVLEESNRDAWNGIHACIWYLIIIVTWFWGLIFFDMAADKDENIVLGIEVVLLFAVLLPILIFIIGRIRYHPKVLRWYHRMRASYMTKTSSSSSNPTHHHDDVSVDHSSDDISSIASSSSSSWKHQSLPRDIVSAIQQHFPFNNTLLREDKDRGTIMLNNNSSSRDHHSRDTMMIRRQSSSSRMTLASSSSTSSLSSAATINNTSSDPVSSLSTSAAVIEDDAL